MRNLTAQEEPTPRLSGVSRRSVMGFVAAVAASPALATRAFAAHSSWRRGMRAVPNAGEGQGRPRFLHAAIGLKDGRVVVTGGYGVSEATRSRIGGGPLSSVQMYDPYADAWTDLAPMRVPRARHAAVLLDDGRIAVMGGLSATSPLGSVEVYDPATNEWTDGEAMPAPTFDHAASVCGDQIIVTGGQAGRPAQLLSVPATAQRARP